MPATPLGGAVAPRASAAGACGTDGPCVVVTLVGPDGPEGTATVSAAELDEWHDETGNGETYEIRDEPGGGTTNFEVPQATSLRTIVQHLADRSGSFENLSVEGVSTAFVYPDGAGYRTGIDGKNLKDPGQDGYVGGLSAAFYPVNASVIGFARPLAPDSQDVNKDDFRSSTSDGAFRLDLTRTGTTLRFDISTTSAKVRAGEKVGLLADPVPSGHGAVTYSWDFFDGDTSAVARPTHSWGEEGTYDVRLDITTTDGSSGFATVEVQVGPKKKPDDDDDDDDDPKPGHGELDDDDNPVNGPNDAEGDQAGGDPDGSPDGARGGQGDRDGSEAPGSPSDQDPARGDDDAAVTGVLVSDTSGSTSTSEAQPAALEAAGARAPTEPQRDPLLYAALAVPLLLLAGALGETRPAVAAAARGLARRTRRRGATTEETP